MPQARGCDERAFLICINHHMKIPVALISYSVLLQTDPDSHIGMLIAGSRGRRVKDKLEMACSTGGMAEGSTVYNGPCGAARHTNSVSANPRRSQTLCIEVARMCSSAPLLTWRSFFFSVAWNHGGWTRKASLAYVFTATTVNARVARKAHSSIWRK